MKREHAEHQRRRTVLGRALNPGYDIGASFATRAAWYVVNLAVLYNPLLPLSLPRVLALRAFGAKIGNDVVIKPQVKVKFPWRLSVGDGAWIGEECWIDNIDQVSIGSKAVLSQRTYLCTGNHDWSEDTMPLRGEPIEIGDGAWIGAGVVVAPGSQIGSGTVVALGSVVNGTLPPETICAGNPAEPRKARRRTTTRP
jgi:putative colanic acid biosynthesis acetyltransferase WcaF